MSWGVAEEILEGRSTYSSWMYSDLVKAICNKYEKGSQGYEYYMMRLKSIS